MQERIWWHSPKWWVISHEPDKSTLGLVVNPPSAVPLLQIPQLACQPLLCQQCSWIRSHRRLEAAANYSPLPYHQTALGPWFWYHYSANIATRKLASQPLLLPSLEIQDHRGTESQEFYLKMSLLQYSLWVTQTTDNSTARWGVRRWRSSWV